MEPQTLHTLELTGAIVGQTVLLAAGWGFLAAVVLYNPLVASDSLAGLMFSKPTETTWIITLLATILSVATTTFLPIAFKEALRHRMHKSISLIHLSGGIALARNSFLINFRHPISALVTILVFGVTKLLLVSSWAALLTPTLVPWTVDASGWELDLTGGWFESQLQQELGQSGAALVRGNSTEIISLEGVLSGVTAAQYSFGTPGIFDFNGVKYNISTGGVLPAVPSYNGSTDPVSANNVGLAFAGGLVPTHLDVNFPNGRTIEGLYSAFALQQQGLTANVTCHQTNTSLAGKLNLGSSFYPIPVPFANGTTDYWLWAWNITSNCSQGQPSQQQYVTRSNSPTVPQASSSGLISSLVCPYPLRQTDLSWETFTVVTNASWKYDFLPLTVCTINPLVTTSLAYYSNGIINTTVISSRSLGNNNTNLTQFLAAIVDYQSRTTQTLTTNTIGDALYSIYVSTSGNNSSNSNSENVTNLLLWEMEQYWRGVIEFSGTFLRSAFSAYPRNIPTEGQTPLSGYETITTMGWYRQSATWGYMIIPITIVALMMYAAVAYTLWHVFIERGHESFTMFDPSNPIHLMMVSSTRERNDLKDNLEDGLWDFERGGIGKNEDLRVQLMNVNQLQHRKRFMVINNQTSMQ